MSIIFLFTLKFNFFQRTVEKVTPRLILKKNMKKFWTSLAFLACYQLFFFQPSVFEILYFNNPSKIFWIAYCKRRVFKKNLHLVFKIPNFKYILFVVREDVIERFYWSSKVSNTTICLEHISKTRTILFRCIILKLVRRVFLRFYHWCVFLSF